MGFDKLFAQINGRPVLWHSIRAFASLEAVDEVIVVTQSERASQVEGLLREATDHKRVQVVEGGAERHLSVWEGLKAVSSKSGRFVAIHDGARPLITAAAINGCLEIAGKEGAACCAAPIPDTVKRANDQGVVVESVDRTGLWAMQTPQIFSLELIHLAYVKLMEERKMPTDEVSAVEGIGAKVALVQNADWNFKITFPKDIEMAAQVLSLRSQQTGVQL